jgi:hypothetical protein
MQHLKQGTHAYKLTSQMDNAATIEGYALSPDSDKMSSSPTEHYGAIAVLDVLVVLFDHHDVSLRYWPRTTLLIDNKEVVTRGEILSPSFMNVSQYLTHDFDLWMVMADLQQHINITIDFEWIQIHQDNVDNEEAQVKPSLNADVDTLASRAYSLNGPLPERGAFLAGTVCYHQQGKHVQSVHDAITARESDARILQYYISKGWTLAKLDMVDWIGLQSFLKTQSPISRCKILQTMHNWQHTGHQKHQFQQSASDHQCNKATENLELCPLGCGNGETSNYRHI